MKSNSKKLTYSEHKKLTQEFNELKIKKDMLEQKIAQTSLFDFACKSPPLKKVKVTESKTNLKTQTPSITMFFKKKIHNGMAILSIHQKSLQIKKSLLVKAIWKA